MNIDASGIDALISRNVEPWLAAKVDSIASLAMQNCPVGDDDPLGRPRPFLRRLKDSISSGIEGFGRELVGRVTAATPYAMFVHEGTRPHQIPTGGSEEMKARGYPLRFYWPKKGRVVRFMSVQHPGTTAQPFLRDAMVHVISASPR